MINTWMIRWNSKSKRVDAMMMSLVILIVLLLFRLHACETKRYEFVAFASSREGGATSLQEELRRPLGRRESLRQLLLRGGCLRSSSSSSSSSSSRKAFNSTSNRAVLFSITAIMMVYATVHSTTTNMQSQIPRITSIGSRWP
mmetsp:Transcript_6265/g.8737  ORF Transcript_6265/g.8737 Transcript_6265/m.8737 type:complete len:143 (-) Transcript_6265:152-580(-)